MVDKSECIGCEDNFYNGNNPYGVTECWSLKKAEMIKRWRLSIHTSMGQKSGYHSVETPNCFHQRGYVFLKEIPAHAK